MSHTEWKNLFLYSQSGIKEKDFSIQYDFISNGFNKTEFIFIFVDSFLTFTITKNNLNKNSSIDIDSFNSGTSFSFSNIYNKVLKSIPLIKEKVILRNKIIFDGGKLSFQYKVADSGYKETFDFKYLNYQKIPDLINRFVPDVLKNKKGAYLIMPKKYSKKNMYLLNKNNHNFYKYFVQFWDKLKEQDSKKMFITRENPLRIYDKYSTYLIDTFIDGINVKIMLIFKN